MSFLGMIVYGKLLQGIISDHARSTSGVKGPLNGDDLSNEPLNFTIRGSRLPVNRSNQRFSAYCFGVVMAGFANNKHIDIFHPVIQNTDSVTLSQKGDGDLLPPWNAQTRT